MEREGLTAAELADYMADGEDNPCGLAVTAAYIKEAAGADGRSAPGWYSDGGK
jgi:hypothetical protein